MTIYVLKRGLTDIYNHDDDPGERRDFAADEPETVAGLRDQLRSLLEARKAK